MFDALLRPIIDPPLNAVARLVARAGVGANVMTVLGALAGVAAGVAIGQEYFKLGAIFIVISRLADGLDGPLARQTRGTDFGGYLDIVADYVFYAAVPLGFAFAYPQWALPAACLLGGFLLAGTSFLGFATLAVKRGLETSAQGVKSIFYLGGLAEGAETIAVFLLSALAPAWFPALAYSYAVLCVLTVAGRLAAAARLLSEKR